MKATQLIIELAELIAEFEDMEVVYDTTFGGEADIEKVKVSRSQVKPTSRPIYTAVLM
jgi:hypothetical protein